MRSPSEHAPQRWQKLGVDPYAHTRIFDVQSVHYQHPRRGTKKNFFVIDAPDWVMVIALTPARELVLVRQFRYGIDDFSLEPPGGVVDRGEDPMVAGVRELREETGYVGDPARLLGSVHPNPAMQNNRMHILLVENARRTADESWDEDEEIEIAVRPVDEVFALATSGGITHALALDALLLFSPIWQKLKGGGVV
ncbi:MAG TPA: NUDIX hydrolase [Candidatus Didemnitutus sp.]|nr:NUDIX hydrolase [Candidatus Didemnitutus sp.]